MDIPHVVYFELFGKKMKTEVLASSQEDARYKVLEKVIFHKIEPVKQSDDEVFNNLKDIFGMK